MSLCSRYTLYFILLFLFFAFNVGAVTYVAVVTAHIASLCVNWLLGVVFLGVGSVLSWLFLTIVTVRNYRQFRQVQRTCRADEFGAEQLQYEAVVEDTHNNITVVASSHLYEPTSAPKKPCCNCRCVTVSILTFLVVLILLVVFSVFAFILYIEINTLPTYTGTMHLDGITAPVTIAREDNGMIHVSALTQLDAIYAQGVVHMQNRMWQMEFQRRVGAGRLSEAVGSNADAMKVDKFVRTIGFYTLVQRTASALSPSALALVQAYVQGINSYLSTKPALALEFILLGIGRPEPWTVADVLVWEKMMAYNLCGNMDKELQRYELLTVQNLTMSRIDELMPPFQFSRFPTVLPGDAWSPPESATTTGSAAGENAVAEEPIVGWYRDHPEQRAAMGTHVRALQHAMQPLRVLMGRLTHASNNWVVGSSRSATGKPFVCNDPHLQLQAPSIWILIHLSAPGYNVIGASFPGVPGVVIGHNEHIAWGVTNTGADVQDLYMMQQLNATHYQYQGAAVPYDSEVQFIKVHGSADVPLLIRRTVYGPVISDLDLDRGIDLSFTPLALHWVTLFDNDTTTLESFFNIQMAKNWSDYRAALRPYGSPSQNFIFADTAGNIGYQMPGVIPIRVAGHTGRWPVPGNGSYNWVRFHSFDALPHAYNPEQGFVASANNAVVNATYADALSHDWDEGSDGYRAKRITEMIMASNNSMMAIQQDYISLLALDFMPVIRRLRPITPNGLFWQARLLQHWNGMTYIGSRETTVFQKWYNQLLSLPYQEVNQTYWDNPVYIMNVFNNSYPDPNCLASSNSSSSSSLSSSAAPTLTCLEFATQAFENATNDDDEPQAWGDSIHRAFFGHDILAKSPLACMANREIGHGGDQYTVNVGSPSLPDGTIDRWVGGVEGLGRMRQEHGSSYRQIVDLSNLDGSLFIHPLGQMGSFLSSWYDNYLDMWANGQYLAMKMNNFDESFTLTLSP